MIFIFVLFLLKGAKFNPDTLMSAPTENPLILASGAGCNELINWCFDNNFVQVGYLWRASTNVGGGN